MKSICLAAALAISIPSFAKEKVVYGPDDRLDISEVMDTGLQKLVRSTVAMIPESRLKLEEGEYHFKKQTLASYESL